MPADRPRAGVGGVVVGSAALVLAVCCGLPVLLSVGAGITIAGLGLRSLVLVLAGLVAAACGGAMWRRRHHSHCVPTGLHRRER